MKIFEVALAVMAITACGGSNNNNLNNGSASCSVTLSGAQTGTYNCQAALGSFTSSSNKSGVGAATSGTTPPDVAFSFVFSGDLHTGTFKDTDAGAIGIVSVQTAASAFWAAEVGQSNSDPKRGSYTLNLTSIGSRLAGNAGAAYVGLKGTVTAVLEPIPGSGATGNINLTATFQ